MNKLRVSLILRNWKIPAVLIVLLVIAILSRWDTTYNKINDNVTSTIKTDKWNKSIIVYRYNIPLYTTPRYIETTVKKSPINMYWASSEGLSRIWWIVLGVNLIWLFISSTYPTNSKKGTSLIQSQTLVPDLPDDDLIDYSIIGATNMIEGVDNFKEWSNQLINEFGDEIKPHLKTIWKESKITKVKLLQKIKSIEELE